MDRLLKSAEPEIDSKTPDARQVYKHWLRAFERFVQAVEATRAQDDPEIDKYGLLVNFISSEIYSYIEGTTEYQPALALLQRAYVKPVNTIIARHMLSTRSQQPVENHEEFLKQLRQLAKDCNFDAVNAQTYL